MSYFGLWTTSDTKQDGAEEGLSGSGTVGTTVGCNPHPSGGGLAPVGGVEASAIAGPCHLAPDTPEMQPRLLSSAEEAEGAGGNLWRGPSAGKEPLRTPFAAMANEPSSFKSMSSGEPSASLQENEPTSSAPSQPAAMEEPEAEPSTASVVLDLLTGFFTAKSSEVAKEGEAAKEAAKEEEEEDSGPVALYFPFSSSGPPPPPPIPPEAYEMTTDEEEGSVDLMGRTEPVTGVLEKARDVLKAGTEMIKSPELLSVGGEAITEVKVVDISVSSTPEPTTPDNAPGPISVAPSSPEAAAHLPPPPLEKQASTLVPLLRVNTGEKALHLSFIEPAEVAETGGSDTGSQAPPPGTPEATPPPLSPFHASSHAAPTAFTPDSDEQGQRFEPVIAAAEVVTLTGQPQVGQQDGVRVLPVIRTHSGTELVMTSTPGQGNDLMSWLWGNPAAAAAARERDEQQIVEAPPPPQETQVVDELPKQSTAEQYTPDAGNKAGEVHPTEEVAESGSTGTPPAAPHLPPIAPPRRRPASFDGDERSAGSQSGSRTAYLSAGLLRSDGGSTEGSLKSCLRSPCGSENGRSEDEPVVNGAAGLKRVNSNFKMVRFAEGVVDEEHPLNERFKRDNPDGRLIWMEEPEKITCGSGALYFQCRPGTDCWQRTGLDVSRDNPHFLHIPRSPPCSPADTPPFSPRRSARLRHLLDTGLSPLHASDHFFHVPKVYGDFVMTTHVRFMHMNDMDQAGLMVRLNSSCWLKACVTNHPAGSYQLGAVATNGGFSDWSMAEFPSEYNEVDLRIRREATSYVVEARRANKPWKVIRILTLLDDKPGGPVMAGLYGAAPSDKGASAEYKFLTIVPGRLTAKPSHVEAIPE